MLWMGLCGVEDLQSMADHRLMVIDVPHHDDHHRLPSDLVCFHGLSHIFYFRIEKQIFSGFEF